MAQFSQRLSPDERKEIDTTLIEVPSLPTNFAEWTKGATYSYRSQFFWREGNAKAIIANVPPFVRNAIWHSQRIKVLIQANGRAPLIIFMGIDPQVKQPGGAENRISWVNCMKKVLANANTHAMFDDIPMTDDNNDVLHVQVKNANHLRMPNDANSTDANPTDATDVPLYKTTKQGMTTTNIPKKLATELMEHFSKGMLHAPIDCFVNDEWAPHGVTVKIAKQVALPDVFDIAVALREQHGCYSVLLGSSIRCWFPSAVKPELINDLAKFHTSVIDVIPDVRTKTPRAPRESPWNRPPEPGITRCALRATTDLQLNEHLVTSIVKRLNGRLSSKLNAREVFISIPNDVVKERDLRFPIHVRGLFVLDTDMPVPGAAAAAIIADQGSPVSQQQDESANTDAPRDTQPTTTDNAAAAQFAGGGPSQ
jgi:hypothetical protein